MALKPRTYWLDEEIIARLDRISIRHGDKTFHVVTAIEEYLDEREDTLKKDLASGLSTI